MNGIVRAGADDLERLAPLFEAYLRFYRVAADEARARAFLAARLNAGESAVFLAQDERGDAAGFAQLYPGFTSIALAAHWTLEDLFVAPAKRRTGIASALLAHAEAFAVRTGADRLILSTAIDNRTAQRVYDAAGWMRDEAFYTYQKLLTPTRP